MARYMRALCCKEQPELLNAYLEASRNTMRYLGPFLKSISLRGNPKESVKHKSNNNGCVWRGGIVIVVFVSLP